VKTWWVEAGLFLAVLIFLFMSQLRFKYKAAVFLVYLSSEAVVFWLTADIPYRANTMIVNAISILIPVFTTLAAWYSCVGHQKHNQSMQTDRPEAGR